MLLYFLGDGGAKPAFWDIQSKDIKSSQINHSN
jgi:hypothetical protein